MSDSPTVNFLRAQLNLAEGSLAGERSRRTAAEQRAARTRVLLYDLAVRLVPGDLDQLRKDKGEIENAASLSDEELAQWLRQRLDGYLFHYRQLLDQRDLKALKQLQTTLEFKQNQVAERDAQIEQLTRQRADARQEAAELKERVAQLGEEIKALIEARDEIAEDLKVSRGIVEQLQTQVAAPGASADSTVTTQPRFPAPNEQSPGWYADWWKKTPAEQRERQRAALEAVGQGTAFFRGEIVVALNARDLLSEADPDRPAGAGQRLLTSLLPAGDGFVEEIDVNYGPTVPRPLQLSAKGREALALFTGEEPAETPFQQLVKRHKTPEHTTLCLLARRVLMRFGHAVELTVDPIQLASGRSAYPDLRSTSPENEVMYWECETGKVQRSPEECDTKWAAHAELNRDHFYVFVPTVEAQKEVLSEINQWLDEHRPQHVWICLSQYTKAMRAEGAALWAINSKYNVG